MPGGLSAIWSFGEMLRIVCATELDVNPNELQAGLQPLSLDETLTQSIFISDALENGAGYATHLSSPEIMGKILDRIVSKESDRLEDTSHDCDSSCPDCLRSYDNRRLHSLLDWRLALDVAELVVGKDMKLSRWLDFSEGEAESMKDTIEAAGLDAKLYKAGGLHGVIHPSAERAVLFTHPLWRLQEPYWTNAQKTAVGEAMAQITDPSGLEFFDLYSHRRQPQHAFVWLAQGQDTRLT
jgi:DEAD/DEAH box helicase domain-containing protein